MIEWSFIMQEINILTLEIFDEWFCKACTISLVTNSVISKEGILLNKKNIASKRGDVLFSVDLI